MSVNVGLQYHNSLWPYSAPLDLPPRSHARRAGVNNRLIRNTTPRVHDVVQYHNTHYGNNFKNRCREQSSTMLMYNYTQTLKTHTTKTHSYSAVLQHFQRVSLVANVSPFYFYFNRAQGSCVKVEWAVLASPSLILVIVSWSLWT